jgi:hypothetical protein
MGCNGCIKPAKPGKVFKIDLPILKLDTKEKYNLFIEATEYWWKFLTKNSTGECPNSDALKIIKYCNELFKANYNISDARTAIQMLKLLASKYRKGEYKPIINIEEDEEDEFNLAVLKEKELLESNNKKNNSNKINCKKCKEVK